MMRRATWFVSGAVAGAAGVTYASHKVKQTAAQLAPTNVAKVAARRVKGRAHDLAEAVRDGRAAMRAKEAQLKARRDGLVDDLEPHLAPGDLVYVDGLPAEPGQVIVLRQPRPESHPAMRAAAGAHSRARRRSR